MMAAYKYFIVTMTTTIGSIKSQNHSTKIHWMTPKNELNRRTKKKKNFFVWSRRSHRKIN